MVAKKSPSQPHMRYADILMVGRQRFGIDLERFLKKLLGLAIFFFVDQHGAVVTTKRLSPT